MTNFDPHMSPQITSAEAKKARWRIAGVATAGLAVGALAIGGVWAGISSTKTDELAKPVPVTSPAHITDAVNRTVSSLLPAEKSSDLITMPPNSTTGGDQLKAIDASGKPLANKEIEYTVTPGSGLHFAGKSSVKVKTDENGRATMPNLSSGSESGIFNVVARAAGGNSSAALTYTVTVQMPEIQPPVFPETKPEIQPPVTPEPEVLPAV